MSNSPAGKGDKPRPVKKEEYDNNFDKIVWRTSEKAKNVTTKKGKTIYKY